MKVRSSVLSRPNRYGAKVSAMKHDRKVKMYVCGVTVYDDIHMGHARSIIVFDMIARYLRSRGYEVTHLTNFTDVDDKIINRAAEMGMEPLALSKMYIDRYFQDIESLGVHRADGYPKASENIPQIIAMVQKIIDHGFAYKSEDGSVYFSVDKVEDYGRLTGQKLEDMQAGARVEVNELKRNPYDFALWKAAKPGEISWDSPWGKGRPGWHIECSAMTALGLAFPPNSAAFCSAYFLIASFSSADIGRPSDNPHFYLSTLTVPVSALSGPGFRSSIPLRTTRTAGPRWR